MADLAECPLETPTHSERLLLLEPESEHCKGVEQSKERPFSQQRLQSILAANPTRKQGLVTRGHPQWFQQPRESGEVRTKPHS